jgi:hypothetical protein
MNDFQHNDKEGNCMVGSCACIEFTFKGLDSDQLNIPKSN